MDLAEYKARFQSDASAPGWNAITARLEAFYPSVEPKHYGTVIKHMLGGPDPLDGISIYRAPNRPGLDVNVAGNWHYHYVSYGFSRLYYDEADVGKEFSGFGFEMTFRLAPYAGDGEWPVWPCNMMQNLARYVFKSGRWFEENHWIPANGPLRLDTATDITGGIFIIDPALGAIDTPHGAVQFIQLVGITGAELDAVREGRLHPADLSQTLARDSPMRVTDLTRRA